MTQTATTVFRAWGKDRLSDPWFCYEAPFRWQVERWISERAFAQRDWQGAPLVTEVALEGRSCIEWRVSGTWQPYTAWEDAARRPAQIDWIRAEKARGSVQTFRIVIEDEPNTLVALA
jgi:hypothetical protein